MKCVSCGCELPEDSLFCIKCGAKQPQNKICPKCHAELPMDAMFCFKCGCKLSGDYSLSSSGINMGDKNVVAGDVIGHKENYNVSGNATIIKNEDETKKVVRCHVCFKNITIVNTHTCPICGEPVCDNCFDVSTGMCISCRDDNKTSGENEYREALKKVYEDGRVDLDERRILEALQQRLGLSDTKANELENEIRFGGNANIDSFTTVEKLNMEDATELFYERGEVEKAYELMTCIYDQHKYDEKVLDLYLPILAEYDRDKALSIIQNLKADMLTAYLVQIDIYTKSDLSKAERVLDSAERIWNNNLLLMCRRINWLYKMYKETGRDMFYDKIRNLVSNLPSANTKLERTWKARAESIINAGKDDLAYFTESKCKLQNIFLGYANSYLFIETIIEGLTDKPILLQEGTDGSLGTDGKYVLFGDWPQTIKADDVVIDESRTYKVNAWNCYKGSDGCYYVKEIAKPCNTQYTYSNGQTIIENKEYFFKLESIKWRILDNNYGSGKLLLSENILTVNQFDSHMDSHINHSIIVRRINGKTIHGNNYEYSHIRAYLNGLNGSAYEVEDFTNNGFINKAFSKKAIERINTVTVDNSVSSTTDSGSNIDTADKYICNNTKDKIFLLSLREVTKASYGFDAYDKYIGDDYGSETLSRSLQNTDYSLAIGSYTDSDDGYINCGYWWLRSPYVENYYARFVMEYGYLERDSIAGYYGIVPALSISF